MKLFKLNQINNQLQLNQIKNNLNNPSTTTHQMEMSRDSINELMIMSQDSLKQRSTDSLDSEQELKFLSSHIPTLLSNETDDFIINTTYK